MSQEIEVELSEIRDSLKKIENKINSGKIEKTHYKAIEACRFLSCSRNTLNAICIEYEIYPVKVLGVYYYKLEDLQKVFLQKTA